MLDFTFSKGRFVRLFRGMYTFFILVVCGTLYGVNVGENPFTINVDGYRVSIPVYRNFPLDSINNEIERVIIVIHGSGRNAEYNYETISHGDIQVNRSPGKVLIIAPQFVTEDDIVEHELPDSVLFWSSGGWKKGNLSLSTTRHPRPVRVSSFAFVDSILERVIKFFPEIRNIVIAGHSAGGQFVNRYAAGSPMQDILSRSKSVHFRYIVANPSSYLYFNKERVVEGTQDKFAVPSLEVMASCPDFNDYKYGLDDLNSYMEAVGVSRIREQYKKREVIYLLGKLDSDPDHPQLDKSCPAMLQGRHRLERGKIYYNYLKHYYGEGIVNLHKLVVIPGVAHSSRGIFSSACGIYFLFDKGECRYSGVKREEVEVEISEGFKLLQNYPNPFNSETKIGFYIYIPAFVRLEVLNLIGYVENVLISGFLKPGFYSMSMSGKNLSSGIYFCRLSVGGKSQIKKMILQK